MIEVSVIVLMICLGFVIGLISGFVFCAVAFERGWFIPTYVYRSRLGSNSKG